MILAKIFVSAATIGCFFATVWLARDAMRIDPTVEFRWIDLVRDPRDRVSRRLRVIEATSGAICTTIGIYFCMRLFLH